MTPGVGENIKSKKRNNPHYQQIPKKSAAKLGNNKKFRERGYEKKKNAKNVKNLDKTAKKRGFWVG